MVSGPLRPGVFTEMAAKLIVELEVRAAAGLEATGKLVEDRTRAAITAQSHAYRTPTPASRGGPPARISGTLAASLSHSKPAAGGVGGLVMRVGTVPGRFPPYGRGRTPSSLYGLYLEKLGAGVNHVTYPFLKPTYERVKPEIAGVIRAAFAGFGRV